MKLDLRPDGSWHSYAPHLLSLLVGFMSLSQEVLWVRLFGFANESGTQAFSLVLATYLLGIAIGAQIGKIATRSSGDLWRLSGLVLVVSSLFDFFAPWAFAAVFAHLDAFQIYAAGLACAGVSGFKAILFPVAHHLGTMQHPGYVGRSMSTVYASNIAGSALGPLVTGFVLLDILTTQQCFLVLSALSLLVGLCCLVPRWPLWYSAPLAVLGTAIVAIAWLLPAQLVPMVAAPIGPIKRIVENRHGIITVYEGGRGGDIVYGGNVYDGRSNVDPVVNSNALHRVIVLGALHEKPRRVLMIGLSIGSWLHIVESFPGVEEIDVVEINPGYLQAIADYPVQRAAVADSRVRLHFDDGRRWLRGRAGEKWDLVIANTTWHWRAYASNLLSREFLSEIRTHMDSGAVLAYNATGSPDALFTAAKVFPHAASYDGFVLAGDRELQTVLRSDAARAAILALTRDGRPLLPENTELARKFLAYPMLQAADVERSAGHAMTVITDDNLYTEYHPGRGLR